MTTLVTGPGDVAVGDIVEIDLGNAFRQNYVTVTVTRVGPDRMSVRLPDDKVIAKAYKTKASSTIRRLTAWERWARIKPSSVAGSPTFGTGQTVASVVAMASVVRDRPDDVIAQVRLLSEWLKAEPSKDAP